VSAPVHATSEKEWPRDPLVEAGQERWNDLLRQCRTPDDVHWLTHEAIGWMRRQDPVAFLEFVISKEREGAR
jgi:hypothetical protein